MRIREKDTVFPADSSPVCDEEKSGFIVFLCLNSGRFAVLTCSKIIGLKHGGRGGVTITLWIIALFKSLFPHLLVV